MKRLPSTRLSSRPRGATAVEFAMLVIGFLLFLFGVLEAARALYLFNTLQEVTRRGAAMAAGSRFDSASQEAVREHALLGDANGNLLLGDPVTPAYIKIDYLSLSRDNTTGAVTPQPASPMPSCPASNRLNCLADPYSSSCIRLVRVRVCDPKGTADCTPVAYHTLFPLVDFSALHLPVAETMAPAASLGYTAGSVPCP